MRVSFHKNGWKGILCSNTILQISNCLFLIFQPFASDWTSQQQQIFSWHLEQKWGGQRKFEHNLPPVCLCGRQSSIESDHLLPTRMLAQAISHAAVQSHARVHRSRQRSHMFLRARYRQPSHPKIGKRIWTGRLFGSNTDKFLFYALDYDTPCVDFQRLCSDW